MTASAYRSLEPVLVQRISELRDRRERDRRLIDLAVRVAARRIGRAIGGVVGVVFGGASMLVAISAFLLDGRAQWDLRATSTALLLGAWPLAVVAALGGRGMAGRFLHTANRVTESGDAAADLAALQARDPLSNTRAVAMDWERRSAALPMAATSLLAPLSLHWLVWCLLEMPHIGAQSAADFGGWIGVSAVLVGHAHLVLLVTAVRWTGRLRTLSTAHLRDGMSWGLALGVTVGVACVPGIVLLGIPPLLVAVTGLLVVPAMFLVTVKSIERERGALEAS